jgi:hypothetical protein
MWASDSFAKKGRCLGQAEQVMLRAGGWQKARMEQQMANGSAHPEVHHHAGSRLLLTMQ